MNVNKAGHSGYFHKRKLSAGQSGNAAEGGAGLEGGGPPRHAPTSLPAAQRCRSAGSPAQRPRAEPSMRIYKTKGKGGRCHAAGREQ